MLFCVQDKAANSAERFSATTTLTIHVEDGDDLDPTFLYDGCAFVDGICVNPEYKAIATSGSNVRVFTSKTCIENPMNFQNLNVLECFIVFFQGDVIKTFPERIHARDRDSMNASIRYSFVNGTPSFYSQYFKINPISGLIKQVQPVDRSIAKSYSIIIKAEQISESKRSTTARLTIDVLSVDQNPPVINPSSFHGYVNENAPLGSLVMNSEKGLEPLKITVTDVDIVC